MEFVAINKNLLLKKINELKKIQDTFLNRFKVDDIFSNSKIFEITIANELNHTLIPGHSGSSDAKDANGNIFEYKHFKMSSSNHSWTFNDFSDNTIEKLKTIQSVIFAHINDSGNKYILDWWYEVDGKIISSYLKEKTVNIKNTRKMINVSSNQIEKFMNIKKIHNKNISKGTYKKELDQIYQIISDIEKISNVKNILTSNKIWEVLTAVHLNHNVNSEQGGRIGAHDAFDEDNNQYEYKISKSSNWNFQDISENVLTKYNSIKSFVLCLKDTKNIKILKIYLVKKNELIKKIKEKLEAKKKKKKETLRRLMVSITRSDIKGIVEDEITIN